MEGKSVKVWEERVSIPTYETGKPNKNPMFLEKRVYQGSSGVVYPHQVIDKIYDEKRDKEYDVVFLENDYLKIMVMPSLGGRVQMAYDKKNDYHFVYYNRVIKPALVGLTGPWISGGIEFNWPQHHRPSTFEPVDYKIEENNDGSMTLWVSEVELMTRTKGMAGFTLYPGKAYLEITGKLYNRTDVPRTFLWWANPAVVVNDDYESVFPPDVYAVMDHGKRDVSRFPIAVGTYYKMDYSAGVDISRYKNIKVPTSYMVHESKYNFIGGYDHGREAGMLHVADRHVCPGKKQWVWGSGDFGQAWDRNLTDEDGPYAELMTGVFTDNQPDFTWLQPYEEKSFTQYVMPYHSIGAVKNADRFRAISLDVEEEKVTVGVYASCRLQNARIVLAADGETLLDEDVALEPGDAKKFTARLPGNCSEDALELKLVSSGICLLSYSPEPHEIKPLPEPAQAAPAPSDISSIEELFLTGLHVEQYRHATRSAEDYYREALSRDDSDIRCNNALGKLLMKRGRFAEAEELFRKAVKRSTCRNPNPYDGEPRYNLGLSLLYQDRPDEAFEAFFKSVWNYAQKSAGFYHLALISCRKGEYRNAAEYLETSLIGNYHNHKARNLLASVHRRLGHKDKALELCRLTRSIDAGDWGACYETAVIETSDEAVNNFKNLMRGSDNNYIEFSLDYSAAGLYEDALEILDILLRSRSTEDCSPLVRYHRAWILQRLGSGESEEAYTKAASVSPDGCFPSKLESVRVLHDAVIQNPEDSRAYYYLGNFNYGHKNYDEAIEQWKKSIRIDDSFPTVHRNIALALMNKKNDPDGCRRHLEKAFELDTTDSRILYELDQFYKKINLPLDVRIRFLEKHIFAVEERDDLYLEYVALLNGLGRYQEAFAKISARQFHPWEGGEGKVPAQYMKALIGMATGEMSRGNFDAATELLEKCRSYPRNLGEGKLYGTLENDVDYLTGCAYKGLDDPAGAEIYFTRASEGSSEPVSAMYYNDQPPHMIYFQGLALMELGRNDRARSRFNKLVDFGERHIDDDVVIDYFAVSLPDFLVFEMDMNEKNRIHCLFMLALGRTGLGLSDAVDPVTGTVGKKNMELGQRYLQQVMSAENHHGAAAIINEMTLHTPEPLKITGVAQNENNGS